ncbi:MULTISPECIES: pyruvate oxidase [unclassified Staphylococcus]|uniref:pyruvate oxidase n=1 Tax=unclassified Staphylococcus TaxID=91994 RepID=UPI0021D1DC91|nr:MULTISPECIES: pyruvate oxidase [unclassified Staphylococcus]UXR71026.1 pyruvate oxidase [Staphylococcus sp. IVB6240]UXR73253.1 pyruvate oxidase [Staphylococcus sp. IVB6238]UXR75551.1 pyruvate oxidase [Staphylococcus sp. IVB6233]UXR79752.1 pyruvate oxidase [Staphylococcus sp. IVB6218]
MTKVKANMGLIRALEAWDIDHVYGIPGDSIDAVVDGLKAAESRIKFVHVRHEEVASLSAAAYTKLTGKIGVALSIGGPGAIHLLNGMYDAKMDHVPQLVLAGQADSDKLGTKAFQEVNLPHLFEDVAVYNYQLKDSDAPRIFDIVDEAIHTAYEKNGVAVLTLPNNILNTKIEDAFPKTVNREFMKVQDTPNHQIENAASLLKNSKKPVALVGLGAKHAKDEVRAFIEKFKIPTMVTLPAKTVVSDDHPYNLGNIGKIGTKPSYQAMQSADLLILIGTNYPYVDYLPKKDIKAIQIDIDPDTIGHRFNIDAPIIGDTKAALRLLTDAVDTVEKRPFLNEMLDHKETWDQWMQEDRQNTAQPIRPERLMDAINKVITPDSVIATDVGTSTVWSTRYLNLSTSNHFITSSWLGTMGVALPTAIASRIAFPERQVIAITGDGAFEMVMQDFATAVQYHLPMVIFVLNNQELSFIKYEQQAAGELEYGISFSDMDFAKFAELSGGIGYTLKDPEDIDAVVQTAVQQHKPVIVNVYVDPNAAPLPGKILPEEAKNYAKWAYRSLTEDGKVVLDELPPMSTAVKRFL